MLPGCVDQQKRVCKVVGTIHFAILHGMCPHGVTGLLSCLQWVEVGLRHLHTSPHLVRFPIKG